MISLFEHNAKAYEAVVAMLRETGKAAVVHPTGTGKSFIGFKLCEDNATSKICWLSPSEYIFKTQLENLAATGADVPENISFYTYAKLIMMSDEEIAAIHPDFIIIDEFHRCGAEQWGKGVQKLLDTYPDSPIVGLSATNIRYLDNQRDMADELFDGNIASEMTLGEAIARGILSPPTYVISVYSYQKDLEKYRARIKRTKNKAARDEAEKYLEALRRALQKADGLDTVFAKHIQDRSGKYIVFCANLDHMKEMIDRVPEWFGKIDPHPHIYQAYSDDPETSRAFAAFKADQSNHLKLLFCIDMLNEGVHVDDVTGVILFRPTVSPIIYKQQIGRALCASRKKDPIIFDVVNNFENLYSIGSIEQEMQAAITYYRYQNEANKIVADHFKIVDEVKDCRELFDSMNESLSASWDLMYLHARRYFDEHKNLEVPVKFKTSNGYSLGSWLGTQRRVRSGEVFGTLDEDRIAKLDAIGMRWNSYRDVSWEKNYEAAKAYREQSGNLNVSVNYAAPSGLALGRWLSQLRVYRKSGIQSNYLTADRIQQLDALGMIWNVPDYLWENNYIAAMEFYRHFGHLDVPYRYVSANGIKLGVWIRNLRAIREGRSGGASLTIEQIDRLNAVGMLWDDKFTRQWNGTFAEAQQYYKANGNLQVPATYVSPSGCKLGRWIATQRDSQSNLSTVRRDQLSAIGMVWEKRDSWDVRYALAKAYFEEHGDLNVPPQYRADGIWLSKWLNEQRQIFLGNRKGKTLTQEQIAMLKAISFDFLNGFERAWEKQYINAKSYYEQTGDLNVPSGYQSADGSRLDLWLAHQRKNREAGKLATSQIERLTQLSFQWKGNSRDEVWERNCADLETYVQKYGSIAIPADYVSPNGIKLRSWLSNQKSKQDNLTKSQKQRLERLGVSFRSQSELAWEAALNHATQYYTAHGNLDVPNRYVTEDGFNLYYWVNDVRKMHNAGKLNYHQIQQLDAISFPWTTPSEQSWSEYCHALKQFITTTGTCSVPVSYRTEDGLWLGRWVRKQQEKIATLPEQKRLALKNAGFVWNG